MEVSEPKTVVKYLHIVYIHISFLTPSIVHESQTMFLTMTSENEPSPITIFIMLNMGGNAIFSSIS